LTLQNKFFKVLTFQKVKIFDLLGLIFKVRNLWEKPVWDDHHSSVLCSLDTSSLSVQRCCCCKGVNVGDCRSLTSFRVRTPFPTVFYASP